MGLGGGLMGKALMAAAKADENYKSPTKPAGMSMLRAAKTVGKDETESLARAVKEGDVDIAKGLLQTGINVNAKLDGEGRTALMLAVEHSDDKMTEMLVDAGASVEAKDAQGLTAFDYLVAAGEQKDESEGSWFKKPVQEVHHITASADEMAQYVRAEILPLVNQALYACARTKPTDKSPCAFVAEYLLESHAAYQPDPAMMLPHADLLKSLEEQEEITKPLGVSSLEAMIATEIFRKYDVDDNANLEIEQLTCVVLRMAERMAGGPVPDTTVLRAIKTVMAEVALHSRDSLVREEDLVNCLDRICSVFRSFKGQGDANRHPTDKRRAVDVVEELYESFDLNEDKILMPDELFLLLRRVCDQSGHEISDFDCMELFRLLMEHAMLDKDDDELLDKEEVKDAFELVFMFYNQRQGWEAVERRPPPVQLFDRSKLSRALLDLLDNCDEDGCGLAARLELKRGLGDMKDKSPDGSIEEFLQIAANNASMLIEREDYVKWVGKWAKREPARG